MLSTITQLNYSQLIKRYYLMLILAAILLVALVLRATNLNYNSPFSDEAIYIVLGKFSIFQGDWTTYGSANWVAGLPVVYPSMTALAYAAGGLVGSRLLNVIFGVLLVEAIFRLTLQLSKSSTNYRYLAALIAAAIVAGSGVAIYVSRLATYDAPSFYFLVISLVALHHAFVPSTNQGKWFFIAALTLILSFLTKIITGIYVPIVLVYSLWMARQLGQQTMYYWKRYFLLPVMLGGGIYALTNFTNLEVYRETETKLGLSNLKDVVNLYWQNSGFAWFFFLLASYGLFLKRAYLTWAGFVIAAAWVLAFHLATHRLSTLDKHTFLSVIFLAPAIGLGFANLVEVIKPKLAKIALISTIVALIGFFWVQSYPEINRFDHTWSDTTAVGEHLDQITKPGDKILSESGPAMILATYDKIYPVNVTTFDWFEYQKIVGDPAYIQALNDRYFDFIELQSPEVLKDDNRIVIHQLIMDNMPKDYRLVYSKNGYEIYRRFD